MLWKAEKSSRRHAEGPQQTDCANGVENTTAGFVERGSSSKLKKNNMQSVEVGWILKISLQTAKRKTLASEQYTFSSQEKCESFVFRTFAPLLLEWGRTRSDEWASELEEALGFRGRTDEKCLEILANDANALLCLWLHYSRQQMDEGDDAWCWEITRVEHNPTHVPMRVGVFDIK